MRTEPLESIVEQVYERLKAMTIAFEIKPGERLNEGVLARDLGVSRTPLREALSRLYSEELLRFVPGKGFYCRNLDTREIFSLYELRRIVEAEALAMALERARDDDIDALLEFLDRTGPDPGMRTTTELVHLDEAFHEGLIRMSGNDEMLRVLRNINARIRFVRWIDMGRADRNHTQAEHREMLLGLKARDPDRCLPVMRKHIHRRMDEITSALKEGVAQIYLSVRT